MENRMSLEEQLEALKKLKELFDAGVLTQDEFDAKKKEILGQNNFEAKKFKREKVAAINTEDDVISEYTEAEESFEVPPAPTNARNLVNPRIEDFWDKIVRFIKEHWEIDVSVILGFILAAKVRSWFASFHWGLYIVLSVILAVGLYFVVIKIRDKFFAYKESIDRRAMFKDDLTKLKGICLRIWQWLCRAWNYCVSHRKIVIPAAVVLLVAIIIAVSFAHGKDAPMEELPDPVSTKMTVPSEPAITITNNEDNTESVTDETNEIETVEDIKPTESISTEATVTDQNETEPLSTGENVVNISIDCTANWFFDKYDLIIWLDGEEHGKLGHGKSKTFKFMIDDGTHTLMLCKDGDESITGTISFNISDNTDIAYDVTCNSSEVRIKQTHFENMRALEAYEIKTKNAATYYVRKNYQEIENELKAEGFTNICMVAIRDLEDYQTSSVGKIELVSINGKSDFNSGEIVDKNTEVIISYHEFAMAADEVRAIVDSHVGEAAENIINAMADTSYTLEYYVQDELIDNFTPNGYIYQGGYINASDRVAKLDFTTPELIEMTDSLKAFLPKETAERVAVVAMTNGQADDVFHADGNTLNPAKFHSYKDISGFYLWAFDTGNWKVVDAQTWHVTDMKFMISGYTSCVKASMDITFDGKNYIVSNVDKITAAKKYLDSSDTSKINVVHLEPSDYNLFLTVSPNLVSENRDSALEMDRNNKTMPTDLRTDWINDQFSAWNGEHYKLKDLIKKNLNDEKSYKHIETNYVDLTYQAKVDEINQVLKSSGYSQRVSLGDLFIMCEFSAKNAFNATVKNTAFGIAYFDRGQIELIGVE